MKTFNSSFAEIDAMELEILLDLINVYDELNHLPEVKKKVYIDELW